MKNKGKIIIVALAATASISCGVIYIWNKDANFSPNVIEQNKKIPVENTEKDDKEENKETGSSGENSDNLDQNTNSGTANKPETPDNLVNPTTPESPVTPDKPSIPEDPSIPEEPTNPENPDIPDEPIGDFIISNEMLENGVLTLENKKYNTLTISSDVKENARIVLDNIDIIDSLVLESPKKYQLDIVNTKISTMHVTSDVASFVAYSMRAVPTISINRALEGPTVNLKNDSVVNSIDIDSNVEINGTSNVRTVEVNAGTEVVLNIPSQSVHLNTSGTVSINKEVNTLTNSGNSSTIVVNASINEFNNNNTSTIRVRKGNTISNFTNKGEDTLVSGNGTITDLNILANNTKVYTNITNDPKVSENVEQMFIRQEEQVQIVNAYSNAQGSVSFTLSEKVNLSIADISVICNAGKSISLFNLTTNDNLTYTLSTSYYKNDSYGLYITLPNGNVISTDFDTDYANPTVNKVVIERVSDTEATLELYGVDEGGYIYYLLEEVSSRSIIDVTSLKENGKSDRVKVGYNNISINGLKTGVSYNLYYVIEGFFENSSKVNGPFEISGQVKEENSSSYKVVYAEEEMVNRFVFKLDHAPEKELTLDDFEIECPAEKNLTTKGADFYVSPDLLTYVIVVPDNYGHGDNKYKVKIKVSDDETIEGSFVSHFNPPVITGAVDNVVRLDETTAQLTFNSDEDGKVYYGVYEWNGGIYDYNSTTPFASDVITGKIKGKEQKLNAGSNTITVDLSNIEVTNNTRIWALFVDYDGNYRVGFVDHYKIPQEIKGEEPKPDSTLEIVNFEYTNNFFTIDFNEVLDDVFSDDIQLSVAGSGQLPAKLLYIINNDEPKHVSIKVQNYTLPTGTYELTINAYDKNGTLVKFVKKIVID
ncbi:MAG: hypothetical protein K2I70_01095 [Bacilli bacterium]|nr:hypothetical protein [Bacilli bacterium]